MRKILFVCLLSLISLAAKATGSPTITAHWSVTRMCTNLLTFTVSGNVSPLWVKVSPMLSPSLIGSPIYNNTTFVSGNTVTIIVTPTSPTTYYIYAVNPSNYGYYNAIQVAVFPPCSVRKVEINNHNWTERTINVGPEDPNEINEPNLEVKWKLEELDPNTWETLYTIDNPSCWANANMAGASNSFSGFNNEENSYSGLVTNLTCNGVDGILANDKLYRITRYYRLPGEEWQEYQLLSGPGYEDPAGSRMIAPVATAPSGQVNELFNLAQDREQELVSFNTTTDIGSFEIYDISGNKVQTIELQTGLFNYQLKTSGLAPGMYFAYLRSENGLASEKFIIE